MLLITKIIMGLREFICYYDPRFEYGEVHASIKIEKSIKQQTLVKNVCEYTMCGFSKTNKVGCYTFDQRNKIKDRSYSIENLSRMKDNRNLYIKKLTSFFDI
jgi:hypothetical protein